MREIINIIIIDRSVSCDLFYFGGGAGAPSRTSKHFPPGSTDWSSSDDTWLLKVDARSFKVGLWWFKVAYPRGFAVWWPGCCSSARLGRDAWKQCRRFWICIKKWVFLLKFVRIFWAVSGLYEIIDCCLDGVWSFSNVPFQSNVLLSFSFNVVQVTPVIS